MRRGLDRLKPTVTLLAVLSRADGTVIGRQADHVASLNSETPAFLYAEYVDHPENIRTAFTRAIGIATDALLASLTGT